MNRIRLLWEAVLVSLFAMATVMSLQADVVYDATSDYPAGWTTGSNPNGVWTYGWSTTPGGDLTKYTANGHDVVGFPLFDSWSDPANRINNVPDVYLNTGPAVNGPGGLNNLPAGALVIHGGGTAASCGTLGACFSEVVFTAPTTGLFDLSSSFTGRQFGITGLVDIVETSGVTQTILLSGSIADQTSQSLTEVLSLHSGDTITFAARASTTGILTGDTTQLVAALTTATTVVPEPSSFGLLLMGLALLGCREFCIRRSK
jgi:hypothetical protein